MSLNDYSICESRDAEFFEHVFSLKNNAPIDVQNNTSVSISVDSHVMPASDVIDNEHENKFRKSKRHRTETNFDPAFITTFLTQNFNIDTLNDELESIYVI